MQGTDEGGEGCKGHCREGSGGVASEPMKNRKTLQEKMKGIGLEEAEKGMMKEWYIDESKVVVDT